MAQASAFVGVPLAAFTAWFAASALTQSGGSAGALKDSLKETPLEAKEEPKPEHAEEKPEDTTIIDG